MKKILITSIVIAIFGLLFYLFYPNLTIINPSSYSVTVDGKDVGNRNIIRKTVWGRHYLSYGKNSEKMKIINGTLKIQEINLKKTKEPKIEKIDLLKLTPGIESATVKENKILYLGGKRLDAILSFDLTKQEYAELSKKSLRGAEKLVWNKKQDKVLVYLDQEAEVFSEEFQSHIKIWLYDLNSDKLTPLDFSEAAFQGTNVIGLVDGELKKYNAGKYSSLELQSKELFSGFAASSTQILVWNEEKTLLVEGGKTKNINTLPVKEAAVSELGNLALITSTKDKRQLIMIDKNNRQMIWPIEAEKIIWNSEKLLAGSANQLWLINPAEKESQVIFEDHELPIGTFFSDTKGTVYLTNAAFLWRLNW